ncbi:MAG: hypothetical protein EXR43_05645 [Dehalococcoidia bacterium]|nr:hypothetical protein [Dehalococcoidia bacterium]
MRWLVLMIMAALPLAAAAAPAPALAAGPEVTFDQATNRFPDGIRFQMDAQSTGTVQMVELRYRLPPSVITQRALARCLPDRGKRVTCTVDIATDARSYMPPFTEVRYSWRVADDQGPATDTAERSIVYVDTRFQWSQNTVGNLTLYTYGGTSGGPLATAGKASLDRTEALLRAPVGFPVKAIVYNSIPDMADAMQQRSSTFAERVVTLGQRVSPDTVIVLNERDAADTLRHELGHVVTKQAGEGAGVSLPSWLDEGTAVNAQAQAGGGYTAAFRSAVSGDRLFSIRSMTSPTGNPDDVNLFYGEAYFFVRFLVDTHGEYRFAGLFEAFKAGNGQDQAVLKAYGKDLISLENQWRATIGLKPREGGEARNEVGATGTLTPLGIGGIATPGGGGDTKGTAAVADDGGSGLPLLLLAGGALVVAAAAAFVVLRRARRRPTGAPPQ